MSWNYRIVETEHNDEKLYSIHEVYYTDEGEAWGMTESPEDLANFTSVDDLIEALEMILKDARLQPVFVEPEVWPEPPFASSLAELEKDIAEANKGDKRIQAE